jgi:glycosyltransferase involved in cell wall biosynthesis
MGTKEVLEGGMGCLIAADEEVDFAAKAARLLANPDQRANLSEQARAYARSWSAPELADRMLGWYDAIVAGETPGRTSSRLRMWRRLWRTFERVGNRPF